MSIGPEASHMASGRLVALGTVLAELGCLCLLLGAGPFVTEADAIARAAGLAAIAAGSTMLRGAWGLLLRPAWGRGAGVLAAVVSALVGLALVYAAAHTLVTGCLLSGEGAYPSAACLFGVVIATVGVALATIGLAGVRMVRRARTDYFAPRGGGNGRENRVHR